MKTALGGRDNTEIEGSGKTAENLGNVDFGDKRGVGMCVGFGLSSLAGETGRRAVSWRCAPGFSSGMSWSRIQQAQVVSL